MLRDAATLEDGPNPLSVSRWERDRRGLIVTNDPGIGARLIRAATDKSEVERQIRVVLTEGHGNYPKQVVEFEAIKLKCQ